MALTTIQPFGINSSATFTFNAANITNNLTVSGNVVGGNVSTVGIITASGKITAGAVSYANTDGTNGQVLTTYGNGTTYWSTVSGGGGGSNISNGTSNVNIATSGGNVTTSVDGNANILVITGTGANISGTLSVSGNANAGNANLGNLVTANYISGVLTTAAQPKIGRAHV